MPEPCPICENPTNAGSPKFGDSKEVTCETCGRFKISGSWEAMIKHRASMSDVRN